MVDTRDIRTRLYAVKATFLSEVEAHLDPKLRSLVSLDLFDTGTGYEVRISHARTKGFPFESVRTNMGGPEEVALSVSEACRKHGIPKESP